MAKDSLALQAIIEPTVVAMGYELLGCLYLPQGRFGILRLYIDSPSGITVDDCEAVSRQVSAVLDVEDPIASHYSLEVSSPGLDRPLFSKAHYERFIGEQVYIRLDVPLENRRNFKGVLRAVEGEDVIVDVDGKAYSIPLNRIVRANLLPNYT